MYIQTSVLIKVIYVHINEHMDTLIYAHINEYMNKVMYAHI